MTSYSHLKVYYPTCACSAGIKQIPLHLCVYVYVCVFSLCLLFFYWLKNAPSKFLFYSTSETYISSDTAVYVSHSAAGNCVLPFYESNGLCVETCPVNEFGNHTSGQCEQCKCPFPCIIVRRAYCCLKNKAHLLR